MMKRAAYYLSPAVLVGVIIMFGGCHIPPNLIGAGKISRYQCAAAGRYYRVYLPKDFSADRRYPLVVSLHGMKPYDVSEHHVRMWGALADKHRYIIVAPELQTSDSFGQFPLRSLNSAEKRDVESVMAVIDELINDWRVVDRDAVFLSSWSMGGYLAHYIAAEYGDRFAGFAPLQSNFSATILTQANARRWADRLPVFVFLGTGDFPKVVSECRESIEWYRRMSYKVVETEERPIGHQRHPELAAAFFERILARRNPVAIEVMPPKPGRAPLAVLLWPQVSSRIGEISTYHWDFGTVGNSPQKSPKIIFHTAGTYPVRLVVTDTAGKQYVAETSLKVLPATTARNP